MISEGAALLDEIAVTFRRFLSLPPGAAEAMALWVCFTHTFEAQDVAPSSGLCCPPFQVAARQRHSDYYIGFAPNPNY